MKEIFDRVLDREEEADRILREAERKGREIASQAEARYQDVVKLAREKSREQLAAGRELIRSAQEDRVRRTLADYDDSWRTKQDRNRSDREALAEKLARLTAEL